MNYNDWDNVFPEVPQSFHEVVQHTLHERGLGRTGRRKTMKKRFPIVLAAAIAALCVTAAAAYVIQWNGKLAECFDADEQQQSQLASAGAVGSVDQTVTENGLTVTALQTLGDRNGVYLLLDVQAPEDVTLTDTNLFEEMSVDIEGVGDHISWSGGFMSNFDKTASPNGADNERYFELRLSNTEQEDWNGKTITLDFRNLQGDSGKLDMYTIVEGEWKLSWTLSYTDQMQTFDLNKAYTVNGHAVTVKTVELSPLSMMLTLGGDGLKTLIDDSDLDECGCLCTVALTMRDGTTIDEIGGAGGNESYTDTSYTYTSRFGKVLDAEQVTGLTLTFPWENVDNTLTAALR
ncbi:hypothetical protein OBV_33990 [Oscillibacter valericigenes Sjm18-20]|nr:hypothetical protein OBV_33990 [Oscillibacter valericigenes Sjm18-20]